MKINVRLCNLVDSKKISMSWNWNGKCKCFIGKKLEENKCRIRSYKKFTVVFQN